jgi:uncharacterized protein
MQARKEQDGYWIILKKGDEIKSTLEKWAKENNIKGGQIFGIGAIEDITLGYFDHVQKKYVDKHFEGGYELISCIGNLNSDGLHAHICISDKDFNTKAGHLHKAKVAVVGEFFLIPTDSLNKIPLEEFNLRQIDLQA